MSNATEEIKVRLYELLTLSAYTAYIDDKEIMEVSCFGEDSDIQIDFLDDDTPPLTIPNHEFSLSDNDEDFTFLVTDRDGFRHNLFFQIVRSATSNELLKSIKLLNAVKNSQIEG